MSKNGPTDEKDLKNIALQAAQDFGDDEAKSQVEREEKEEQESSKKDLWFPP